MKHSKFFDHFFARSWWTILFIVICLFTYDLAVRKKTKTEEALQEKLVALQEAKEEAAKQQKQLEEEILSQDDPAWVELTLMRKLGLVPENQKKIVFR